MKAAGMKPDEGDRGMTIRIMKGNEAPTELGRHAHVFGRSRTPCMPPSTANAIPVVALAAGDAR